MKPGPISTKDPEAALTLTEWADRIEQEHHVRLWEALDRADGLIDAVYRKYGTQRPLFLEVRKQYLELAHRLSEHMVKEERILFPLIRKLDASESGPFSHRASLANLIRKMASDHERAEAAFLHLRELAGGYAPPADACPAYRDMLAGVETAETAFREHTRDEQRILFPGAIKLEEARDGEANRRTRE
jgi:regulator of cell morphogenesis and NO signaling